MTDYDCYLGDATCSRSDCTFSFKSSAIAAPVCEVSSVGLLRTSIFGLCVLLVAMDVCLDTQLLGLGCIPLQLVPAAHIPAIIMPCIHSVYHFRKFFTLVHITTVVIIMLLYYNMYVYRCAYVLLFPFPFHLPFPFPETQCSQFQSCDACIQSPIGCKWCSDVVSGVCCNDTEWTAELYNV